jgi:hypothetical protein
VGNRANVPANPSIDKLPARGSRKPAVEWPFGRTVGSRGPGGVSSSDVKKVLELILCILHPIAVVLIWVRLIGRSDLRLIGRLAWAIAAIVPFVPFLYVLSGNNIL